MLVSGLWHGAGWTFIAWGALHGMASCVNKAISGKMKKLGVLVNIIVTFSFVTLFWVVFRADSFSTAIKIYSGMFKIHSGINQPYTWSFFAIICLAVGSAAAIIKSRKNYENDKSDAFIIDGFYPILDLSKFWSKVIFFTFCGLTIIMGYFGNNAFIYGAF